MRPAPRCTAGGRATRLLDFRATLREASDQGRMAVLETAGQAWAGIPAPGCPLGDLGRSLHFGASVSRLYHEADKSSKVTELFRRLTASPY